MRYGILVLSVLFLCLLSTQFAFAQSKISPSPTIEKLGEPQSSASSSGALQTFIAGFDWLSSGLVFNTPSILDNTIKLNDGTQLTGLSEFRNIFYDIAVPLFVLVISSVALSHISSDNTVQLKQFFKRLLLVIVLFILTPAILSYSIEFVNLLNQKIIAQNTFNLSTLINDLLNNTDYRNFFGVSFRLPTGDSILQLIIVIISVGFLLIGFIYIIFQAVIRFIALLVLSVIFPVVLPFALSDRTENMANTYFRTWFTFLIQQPAFVLGFAIVSTILTSILQAHNASIGTLFVYSGALIFLGGVNVFIGRIFGDGWSLLATNSQSILGSHGTQRIFRDVKRGAIDGKPTAIRSYAGKFLGQTKNIISNRIKQGNVKLKDGQKENTTNKDIHTTTHKNKQLNMMNESQQKNISSSSSKLDNHNKEYQTQSNSLQPVRKEKSFPDSKTSQESPKSILPAIRTSRNTRQLNKIKPIIVRPSENDQRKPIRRK